LSVYKFPDVCLRNITCPGHVWFLK